MVKLYKKYIENSQNRQQIPLFLQIYFCYNYFYKRLHKYYRQRMKICYI